MSCLSLHHLEMCLSDAAPTLRLFTHCLAFSVIAARHTNTCQQWVLRHGQITLVLTQRRPHLSIGSQDLPQRRGSLSSPYERPSKNPLRTNNTPISKLANGSSHTIIDPGLKSELPIHDSVVQSELVSEIGASGYIVSHEIAHDVGMSNKECFGVGVNIHALNATSNINEDYSNRKEYSSTSSKSDISIQHKLINGNESTTRKNTLINGDGIHRNSIKTHCLDSPIMNLCPTRNSINCNSKEPYQDDLRMLTDKHEEDWTVFCCTGKSKHTIDSVFNAAICVKDVPTVTFRAKTAGSRVIKPPTKVADEHGQVTYSIISAKLGNTVHTLLDKSKYHGPFLPGYVPIRQEEYSLQEERSLQVEFELLQGDCCPEGGQCPIQLTHVDHVAYVCHEGESAAALQWYETVFGMKRFLLNR